MRFLRPLVFALVAAGTLQTAFAQDCNRACLASFVTQYLDAMVAHNPSKLPVSAKVRFTEDGVEMKLGEGLWKDISKVRPYRLDILDTRQGVAASHVVVEAAGAPALFVLRLKIARKKITEVETQVTRTQKEGALFAIDALQAPSPAMITAPDRTARMPRAEAIKTALYYPAGLKIGSFVKVDAPFAPDAYRLENGVHTAGAGCTRKGCENIKTQTIMEHPGITTRVAAVDEDQGIVLLRMNFGQTKSYGEGNALIVWEAFKVYGGQIHAVEAFMKIMPVTTGSGGWDEGAVK